MHAALIPVFALLAAGSAWGQQGIYLCVDAAGKRLTSDRPMIECLDREQKELNASGTVRRTVPPSMTAVERAAQEERDRRAAEERQRLGEDRRMQRALLTRYPNQAAHDTEREKALGTQQETLDSARRREEELRGERRQIQADTEHYKTPAEWPARLKRQLDVNDQQLAAQQRVVNGQQDELKRITRRFDEELARLKLLWAQGPGTAVIPAAAAAR
jgi:hypothetical protein